MSAVTEKVWGALQYRTNCTMSLPQSRMAHEHQAGSRAVSNYFDLHAHQQDSGDMTPECDWKIEVVILS